MTRQGFLYYWFLVLLVVPIHFSFTTDHSMSFDRTPLGNGDYLISVPLSFFAMLFYFIWNIRYFFSKNIEFVLIAIFVGVFMLITGAPIRGILTAVMVLYYMVSASVIRRFFTHFPRNEGGIDFRLFIVLFVGSFLLVDIFLYPWVRVYDKMQYVGPLIASLSLYFFLEVSRSKANFFIGFLWILLSYYYFLEQDSTYIALSVFLVPLFSVLVWVARGMHLEFKASFYIIFYSLNLVYIILVILLSGQGVLNFRDVILGDIFPNLNSMLFPFLNPQSVSHYSAHSFFFEIYRFFGVFSLYIFYIFIKYSNSNRSSASDSAAYVSVYIFVVLGLVTMPQLHFYTIPLLLILFNLVSTPLRYYSETKC